jgi:hypothetical protein
MMNDLLTVSSTLPARSIPLGATESRPAAQAARPGAAPLAPNVRPTGSVVDPGEVLDRASRAAARAMFPNREVDVTSFRDEGSDRIVYRVADRETGRVLVQSPPDALLRFYASARQALAEPLLALEA